MSAETIACAVFLALSVALLATRDHVAAPWLASTIVVGKVSWLVASVAHDWKPGWWEILDPIGPHPTARLLFFASIAQGIALLAVAVRFVQAAAACAPGRPRSST